MVEGESYQLKQTIERSHGCAASLIQSVRIHEIVDETMAWEGVVHVFELAGHPRAIREYGWFSSVKGSEKRRLHAVLHTTHVSSPRKAVHAVLAAERKLSKLSFPHLAQSAS
jgi:hypothetical protein